MISGLRGDQAASPFNHDVKILTIGGIFLIVAGLVAGEIFALFVSHAINNNLRLAWEEVLAIAGQEGSAQLALRFEEIRLLATSRARAMSFHSHITAYGILAASLGVAKTFFGETRRTDALGAWLVLAGGGLQAAGFFTLNYQSGNWVSLSNVGALTLWTGLLILALNFVKGRPLGSKREIRAQNKNWLLRLGASLVLVGLLFGLYLAWRNVFFSEPQLHATISNLIAALVAGEHDTAVSLYKIYKKQQVTMAITAAAHSHAIAFGFVMMIVSLLGAYIRLPAGWRRCAYYLIASGGLLLPVFVYLAPRYGYAFALCADSAGGFVIIGLLIILTGLLKKKGADA